MSEDDLIRVTKNIPMLVEAASVEWWTSSSTTARLADVLDPSTRRQIRVEALDHLGCRDLYDALGVSCATHPNPHIEARRR